MQLDKHPMLMQGHELIIAIEECGCSEKLTKAVILAGNLINEVEKLVDLSYTVALLHNRKVEESNTLLNAVKLAYRKHYLDDPNIGWVKISDVLLNALCNVMGDESFLKWMNELKSEPNEP